MYVLTSVSSLRVKAGFGSWLGVMKANAMIGHVIFRCVLVLFLVSSSRPPLSGT